MRWMIERKLRTSTTALRAARTELATLDSQVVSLRDDADDLEIRSLTADGGAAAHVAYEHRQAVGHVEAVDRQRQRLRERIEALEAEQDRLLDRLNGG
jgi:chromosome segregation ATPase